MPLKHTDKERERAPQSYPTLWDPVEQAWMWPQNSSPQGFPFKFYQLANSGSWDKTYLFLIIFSLYGNSEVWQESSFNKDNNVA